MKALRLIFLASLLYFVIATPVPDAEEAGDNAPAKAAAPEKAADAAPAKAPAKAAEKAPDAGKGDEYADDKKPEEKPADTKKPEEKPADDKKAGENPADDKEKPADDKKPEEKPADTKKPEEKPADDKKADEKPAEGKEKPAEGEEKPAEGGKLLKEGETCGGTNGAQCEHGLTCKAEFVKRTAVFKCRKGAFTIKPGDLNGPCKGEPGADGACNNGLSCVAVKIGNGVPKNTCVKASLQGATCSEGQPCSAGYKCLYWKMISTVGKCQAENIPRISREMEGCEGKSGSTCGPGMECVAGEGKRKCCKAKLPEAKEGSELPKRKEKCKPPFAKPGVCAEGLLCLPNHPYTKDKMPNEGTCDTYGLQGDTCVDGVGFKRPCAEGYDCMELGPAYGSEKSCQKKGSKVAAEEGQVCEGKTNYVCGPGMDCIVSKAKFPGSKMCVKKGEKEKEVLGPVGGGLAPPALRPAGVTKPGIATGAIGVFRKGAAKPAEPKADAKPAEPKADAKPAEPKADAKPAEEKKAEDKPAEDKKAEDKPAEEKKADAKEKDNYE